MVLDVPENKEIIFFSENRFDVLRMQYANFLWCLKSVALERCSLSIDFSIEICGYSIELTCVFFLGRRLCGHCIRLTSHTLCSDKLRKREREGIDRRRRTIEVWTKRVLNGKMLRYGDTSTMAKSRISGRSEPSVLHIITISTPIFIQMKNDNVL